ncbi:efflux RND transporter permease subunit [bacterium]|nr:MAG: efflux RND transporter permease subunit [bacterium]
MKLPEFSVNKRVTTTMVAMIMVVVGLISLSKLGLDFFPDIDFPTVSIITTYSGASSEDIETTITKPLEQIVSSVSRIKKVTSQTSEGVSAISAEFEWGTNLDFAAQDLRDQIGIYKNYLPPDASEPLVVKFNFSQFPIIFWGIIADRPVFQLKKLIEDEVAPRLERIDGVASAQVFATDIREIHVDVDKRALESRNLTLDRVILALQAQNANMPAGNLVERYTDRLVRTLGQFQSLTDLRRTVIGSGPKGEPIYVDDIAEGKDTVKEARYEARIQGEKGVFLMLIKQSGANTALVGNAVHKEMAKILPSLPADIKFHQVMDQSEMVKAVTKRTTDNAWQGGLLAIALIFIFLLNWRPTLIIALAIPLSIITTFIAFYAAGYTLNMLTLGGLALGVGMLVDNAIVVIENTFRHIEEGMNSKSGSVVGASEVGMAITASTLTTIVVFLPMVFATGITAKLTRGLALAITFSLLSSLFVALTIVPLLSSFLFRKAKSVRKEDGEPAGKKPWYLTWQGFENAKAFYRRLLEASLRRRKLFLFSVIGVFVLSLVLIPILGTEFMPTMDQDMLMIKIRMPVGTSLAETNRVTLLVENQAKLDPEISIVTAQVGSQAEVNPADSGSASSASGPHEAILYVGLKKKEQRSRTAAQILESLRAKLPKVKDVKFESLDMSASLMGGAQTPIDIKLFGKDLDVLKQTATVIVDRIKGIEGVRDATHTLAAAKPEYHIRIDRERAAQLGLMISQVGTTVQAATLGKVATRYRDADEEIDVRVRFKTPYRDNIAEIRNIPLFTALNKTVYLDQIATIEKGSGPMQISRENQSRRVSITGNIVGRDLGSVVRDIKKRLGGLENELPQGYFIEYGGAYEQMIEAFKVLFAAMALATLLVYMVMASQFESLLHPFIIMFTIPLGLIGVVIGLMVTGRPVNLPVMVGFILLEGIAVNNGIVMIDYVNQLVRGGMAKREAILLGCSTRLRPVLLTALTTILGMLPMAMSTSSGAEFRAPMAVTVLGGLTATTFLTLFVIPIIYSLFEKVRFKEKKG